MVAESQIYNGYRTCSCMKQCTVNQISIQLRSLHVTFWMAMLVRLVPRSIWTHCVAHIAIYSITHKYISSKRSHVQLTWTLDGHTDKLDRPDPCTQAYLWLRYTMQLRELTLKQKWSGELKDGWHLSLPFQATVICIIQLVELWLILETTTANWWMVDPSNKVNNSTKQCRYKGFIKTCIHQIVMQLGYFLMLTQQESIDNSTKQCWQMEYTFTPFIYI